MKRMLINATHGVRVALVDDKTLYDLEIERIQKQTVNSIFLGKVNRVEPSLGAAFVDFGSTRDGFLPIKEVAREYFKPSYKHTPGERPNIKDVLEPGQEIIVQVVKEERGNKGAALRTFISLAGRYLVLMPNNPRAGGISRQIEGDERDELKYNINQLELPEGMGIIVRTAGVGRSLEELQWDLEFLLSQWRAIKEAASNRPAPFLIYKESDVITKALRDNLKPEIEEILIDNKDVFEQAKEHLMHTRPEFVSKLRYYDDSTDPLFNRYQVEAQIESAYQRVVGLKNGASIVIDPTEALTAIDINSAKATEGSDIEETALNTNIAAAKEIARQLRLRDLGGLIVIDFIDMNNPRHQREVEKQLREELKKDRARVQMGRITRFGLLEMSRQRLQPSLGDANQVTCPTCDGQGTIRGVESLTLSILRVIEEESMKAETAQVQAQVPVDVATYIINEKREALIDLEKRHDVTILIIANKYLSIPHYNVLRVKVDELSSGKSASNSKASYTLATQKPVQQIIPTTTSANTPEEEPAIKHLKPEVPPPPSKAQKESGLIRRLWSAVFGSSSDKDAKNLKPKKKQRDKTRTSTSSRQHTSAQNRNNRNSRYNNKRTRGRNRGGNPNRPQQHELQTEQNVEAKENRPQRDNTQRDNTQRNKKQNRDNRRKQGRQQDNPVQKQKVQQERKDKQDNRRHKSKDRENQKPDSDYDVMTGTRQASEHERAMHLSQEAAKQPPREIEVPSIEENTNGHAFKIAEQQAEIKADSSERKPSVPTIDEPPILEVESKPQAPEKAAPTEEELARLKRKNRIGFIQVSSEEAKLAHVEQVESHKTTQEQAKLKQVVTQHQENPTEMAKAPISALAKAAMKPIEPKEPVKEDILEPMPAQQVSENHRIPTDANTEKS